MPGICGRRVGWPAREEGAGVEVVVLCALADDGGGGNCKRAGQPIEALAPIKAAVLVAGNNARPVRKGDRAMRRATLRSHQISAWQESITRGKQRIIAGRQTTACVEIDAVPDCERAIDIAGVGTNQVG